MSELSENWNTTLQSKVNDIVENMTQQKANLSAIQEQVIRESERLAASNRELYELSERLQRELDQKGKSSSECEKEVAELNRTIDGLRAEIAKQNERYVELDDLRETLETKIREMEERLAAKQEEFDRAIEEAGLDRDSAIQAKNEQIAQLTRDKEELEKQLEQVQQLQDSLKEKIAELERELRDCRKDLEAERAEKTALENEAATLRKDLQDCITMKDRLQRELALMADKNEAVEQQKEALQEALNNLKEKIAQQLDYIMQQKRELIDAPIEELRMHTARVKDYADEAERRFLPAPATPVEEEEVEEAIPVPPIEMTPLPPAPAKKTRKRDESYLATTSGFKSSSLNTGRRGNLGGITSQKKYGGRWLTLPPIY